MTFQYEVIDSIERFELYEKQWKRITNNLNNQNPSLEFDWIHAWWQTLGTENDIAIYSILDEEEVIAFIPFEKKQIKSNQIAYSFLAKGDASYMDILVEPPHHKEVLYFTLDLLLKQKEGVSLVLNGLVEGGKTSKYLDWYMEKGNIEYDFTRVVAPYISIDNEDQIKYFHKRRKSFALNRLEKNFEQQGEVRFEELTEQNYKEIYRLFDERWKMKNDTSGFSTEKNKLFHNKLLTETDLAVVDGLFLDQELVAYTFGYRIRGKYIGFSIAFNPNFDCFGLGNILDRRIIEKSFQVGDNIFDFSIGFEPYKFNWATEIQYIRNYHLGNKNAAKSVKKQNIKNLFREQVKKSKKIVRFKRNTLGKWQYYISNPTRLFEPLKEIFHFSQREIYKLQAKSIESKKMSKEQIPLTKLQLMKNGKNLINSSFKDAKYFLINHKNIYEINNNLIIDEKWDCTIELPKKAVYIKGPIIKDEIGHWNDQDIYVLIKPFERKKKKALLENNFTKLTNVYSMSFLKIHWFSAKGINLKSPKRYKFTM